MRAFHRAVVLVALLGLLSVSHFARATPAECRPLGANSCTNRIPGPWTFLPLGCNPIGVKPTASIAYETARAADYGARMPERHGR